MSVMADVMSAEHYNYKIINTATNANYSSFEREIRVKTGMVFEAILIWSKSKPESGTLHTPLVPGMKGN